MARFVYATKQSTLNYLSAAWPGYKSVICKKEFMKIIGYIFAFLLALIGFLFIAFSSGLNELPNTPLKTKVLGVVFISWGYSLMTYIFKNYKGGPTSIIGAILVGFGIYMSPEIFTLTETINSVEVAATYTLIVLLILGGLILLFQGHRIHKNQIAYNTYEPFSSQ